MCLHIFAEFLCLFGMFPSYFCDDDAFALSTMMAKVDVRMGRDSVPSCHS